MRLAHLLLALLAAACTTLVTPPATDEPTPSRNQALAAYARVLETFVDAGGAVDFEALSKDRADLDTYIRFVARIPFESFAAGDERLAHYIDSYNALAMFNVIESGIPASHAGWRKVIFFALREFVVGGRKLSLHSYENDVIRPLGDARVHFALNCMAVGCPRLPQRPFGATDLPRALDEETRRFFASPDHFRLDRGHGVVHVSELLRFYREDFASAGGSLAGFIDRYAPERVPEGFEVRFIPYDWTVANSRGKGLPAAGG